MSISRFNNKILLATFLVTGAFLTGCSLPRQAAKTEAPAEKVAPKSVEKIEKTEEKEKKTAEVVFRDGSKKVVNEVRLTDDFDGSKLSKDDLIQGCFGGKDCIPSIDKPVFETVAAAKSWMKDEDRIFGLNYQGEFRAYPQRIMNWHEIVNDVIVDEPVIITFCPLCGSAVAFVPKVNGTVTEFGVSGKLHNNDLVMYDRLEGSLWQQITGEAVVGPAAQRNEMLEELPLATTSWKEWVTAHPETKVLSQNTGVIRDYSKYPYGTYESDDRLLYGTGDENQELQLKEPVYGIEIGGKSKAYQVSYVDANPAFSDTVGGVELEFKRKESGELIVTRKDTGERVMHLRLFWFAWAAFHPETELMKGL